MDFSLFLLIIVIASSIHIVFSITITFLSCHLFLMNKRMFKEKKYVKASKSEEINLTAPCSKTATTESNILPCQEEILEKKYVKASKSAEINHNAPSSETATTEGNILPCQEEKQKCVKASKSGERNLSAPCSETATTESNILPCQEEIVEKKYVKASKSGEINHNVPSSETATTESNILPCQEEKKKCVKASKSGEKNLSAPCSRTATTESNILPCQEEKKKYVKASKSGEINHNAPSSETASRESNILPCQEEIVEKKCVKASKSGEINHNVPSSETATTESNILPCQEEIVEKKYVKASKSGEINHNVPSSETATKESNILPCQEEKKECVKASESKEINISAPCSEIATTESNILPCQKEIVEKKYVKASKSGEINHNAPSSETASTESNILPCQEERYIHDDQTLKARDIKNNPAIQELSNAFKKYKNIEINPHLYNKLHKAVLEIMLTWLKEVVENDLPECDSSMRVEGVDAPAVSIDSDFESEAKNNWKSGGKNSLFGSHQESKKEIEVFTEVKKINSPPPPSNFIPVNTKSQNTRQVWRPTPPGIAADKALTTNQIQLANTVSLVSRQRQLRPIVIDGSNIAREHGKRKNVFSCHGIALAIQYFLDRGHSNVTAFVPQYRRCKSFGIQTTDQGRLEMLAAKQFVVFTPSRNIGKRKICSYDDRFIVDLATRIGGVIVSNDNYRDLMGENVEWKRTIEERLLMFCFVDDIFMVPQDPLGRYGPRLDDFLAFRDT